MSTLIMDLRYALRTLRSGWWVTLVALVSLAVAIGGNATVFSLLNAMVLRPRPFESPERLIIVDEDEREDAGGGGGFGTSLANHADFVERSRTTTSAAAIRLGTYALRGTERTEAVTGAEVTAEFFEVLGVTVYRGRGFLPEDVVEGAPGVVLLRYEYWANNMGEGVNPIGTILTLDGEPHEVIGVLPPGFEFLFPNINVYLPLTASPYSEPRDRRDIVSVARMAPGATMETVRAEAQQIAAQLESEHPEIQRNRVFDVLNVRHDFPSAQSRTLMALIQASVLSVLLIACVNITNLLLARGQERQREIALRTALGAGRGRIVRQLFTENALLALAGTAAGLLFGWYGVRILGGRFAPILPSAFVPVLDANVIGFTIAISVVAGLLFGLTPAIQTFRRSQTETLKEGGGKTTGGSGRKRLSRGLVVVEVVLSLVALGGGGMMARSFLRLQNVESGFDRSNLLTAQIAVLASKYATDEESSILLNGIVEATERLSGVSSAALVSALPLGFGAPSDTFRVESGAVDLGENAPTALIVNASPEYRETIGMTLMEGRFFERTDRIDRPLVTVVSRTLADNFFSEESALGKRIHVRGESREIVGVVEDVRQAIFQPPGAATPGLIYLPSGQVPRGGYALIARVDGNPRSIAEPLRAGLHRLDPDLALSQILTLNEVVSQFFVAISAFNAILMGFGIMALLLAALGVYGVLAHSVTRRRKEIGIRLALGARSAQVVRMFAGEGVRLGIIGLGIGLLSTLPISILLRSLLQGVSTVEWNTVLFAGSVLFGVVLLASYVSATKATSVDPVKTLNIE